MANQDRPSDFVFKITLLGDAMVGKTSLRRNYFGQSFVEQHIATLGADFSVRILDLDDQQIKLQIWDLAGQQKFARVRSAYYKGTSGAMLIYDMTVPKTLESLANWIEDLIENSGRGKVPIILLGNKSDLTDQIIVTEEDAKAFLAKIQDHLADSNKSPAHIHTSAVTGRNVKEAFETLVREMLVVAEEQ